MKAKAGSGFKKCFKCFEVNYRSIEKCVHCGFQFRSSTRHTFFFHFRSVFRVERFFPLPAKNKKGTPFFSPQEIDDLINSGNMKILIFFVLDDITLLDEQALTKLGEILAK
jgi:hypothetical protein